MEALYNNLKGKPLWQMTGEEFLYLQQNGEQPERPPYVVADKSKKYVYGIKEIARQCGINKYVCFHVARHTFATLALTKGVSLESVSKILGHTKITTTQIYAKITTEKSAGIWICLQKNWKNGERCNVRRSEAKCEGRMKNHSPPFVVRRSRDSNSEKYSEPMRRLLKIMLCHAFAIYQIRKINVSLFHE